MNSLFPAGAVRGSTASITVNGNLGDGAVSAWCSRSDVQIAIAEDKKTFNATVPAEASPGACWIRFYNAEGASGLRPFIIGAHPEISETEPNNRLQEAQRVEGQTVVANGVLSASEDVDTFAVNLQAGQTLVAELTANRVLGSPMDGVLQLLSPDGFVLAQNDDDQEFDSRLVFTAPADGLYSVRVFAFPANPNQSISLYSSADSVYRLTLSTGPFVDRTWPLAVSAGSASTVRFEGWNLGEEFQAVSVEPAGAEAVAPLFDLRVANMPAVSVVPYPVAVETAGEPKVIAIPSAVSGRIAAEAEIDEYRFTAQKGQQLALEIESRGLGFPLDPVLQLIGPNGETIQEFDDASSGDEDISATHAIPADGEYRVRVFDRFGHGGERYVYLLTIHPAEPAVSLSVAADAFTLTREKPLEIEVQVQRVNGFSGEVAITAVDLPSGVTVTPATSTNEGDAAKTVKLVLTAGETVGGPKTFRIVGTVSGDPAGKQIAATATLANFKATVSDLWLTVPAAP